MQVFGLETILRELFQWLTILLIVGSALASLLFFRLSAWMFLITAGLAGMVFNHLLMRLFTVFAAHLNAGENIHAVFALSSLIGLISWACVAAGLFAVFRDLSDRLRFLEEQQEAAARRIPV